MKARKRLTISESITAAAEIAVACNLLAPTIPQYPVDLQSGPINRAENIVESHSDFVESNLADKYIVVY